MTAGRGKRTKIGCVKCGSYDDGFKKYKVEKPFEGVIRNLERRWRETESLWMREELSRYQSTRPCRNAELLRAGRAGEADLEHIAEEIEDMGQRERRELLSRLGILIAHLLKWKVQAGRRSRSWELTIRVQRKDLARLLSRNPSLQSGLAEDLAEAYAKSRNQLEAPQDRSCRCVPFARRFSRAIEAFIRSAGAGDEAPAASGEDPLSRHHRSIRFRQ